MQLALFEQSSRPACAFIAAESLLGDCLDRVIVGSIIGDADVAVFVVGLGLMLISYRRYRYGEHYEYRRRSSQLGGSSLSASLPDSVRQVTDIFQKLERFR